MIVLKSIHFYLFCEKEKFSLSYDNRPCGENFGQRHTIIRKRAAPLGAALKTVVLSYAVGSTGFGSLSLMTCIRLSVHRQFVYHRAVGNSYQSRRPSAGARTPPRTSSSMSIFVSRSPCRTFRLRCRRYLPSRSPLRIRGRFQRQLPSC